MWRDLKGSWAYKTGTAATVSMLEGETIISIIAYSAAGGTVAIFGGGNIPIAADKFFAINFNHTLCVCGSGNKDIVFTTTTMYFVEYLKAPGK